MTRCLCLTRFRNRFIGLDLNFSKPNIFVTATLEDPVLRNTVHSNPTMCRAFIAIGLHCTKFMRHHRPSMLEVYKQLNDMDVPAINYTWQKGQGENRPLEYLLLVVIRSRVHLHQGRIQVALHCGLPNCNWSIARLYLAMYLNLHASGLQVGMRPYKSALWQLSDLPALMQREKCLLKTALSDLPVVVQL